MRRCWLAAVLGALGAWLGACDLGQLDSGTCDLPPPVSHTRSRCGPTLDFQRINSYAGEFPRVQVREEAVVLVNGNCTGTLIESGTSLNLVLTAGHCVAANEDVLVAFNHEDCADGPTTTVTGRVLERSLAPDYALVTFDGKAGILPTPLSRLMTSELAIIQHPQGLPKVIAEGRFLQVQQGELRYVDLDTLVGGSGGGVLNTEGQLVGVHTNGDCGEQGGYNAGWTAEEIVRVSPLLADSVFALP